MLVQLVKEFSVDLRNSNRFLSYSCLASRSRGGGRRTPTLNTTEIGIKSDRSAVLWMLKSDDVIEERFAIIRALVSELIDSDGILKVSFLSLQV